MRILFLHNNCPGQYRHLAPYLARNPEHDVVFGTTNRHYEIPGVKKVYFVPTRYANPQTHPYLHNAENAVLHGQAVYRMAAELKKTGFIPDIICAHAGWGVSHFVKDVYPDAALLSYFEWYYHSQGADFGFLPDDPKDEEWPLRLRIKNMALNVDLIQCDGGLCPTQWQYQQIPSIFYPKLSVLHDGVDTDFMQPAETATVKLGNIELTKQHEVVTYVSRGLEPYRGFPQFMQAVAKLQKKRPHCQVLIVGEDRVAYGKKREDDKTYKQVLLEELDLDLSRIHFMGYVDYETLRSVFQISTVHIYLTIPFVLSWSILEAMACECIVLGSDTPPVREMISDGENGLLSDFFQIDELVKRTEAILENRERFKRLGVQARKQIIEKYAKSLLLPKHEALIKKVIQQP